MKRNKLSLFSIPYVVWMAIFVVIPILMVVVYAFSSAGGGFTLDNFARIWDLRLDVHPGEHRPAQPFF